MFLVLASGAAAEPDGQGSSARPAAIAGHATDLGLAHRCDRLALASKVLAATHPATPADLLSLRDFGGSNLDAAAPPGFAISPDGTHLAVQVRQAAPTSNTYCQALLVFDLDRPEARPVTITLGPQLARDTFTMYGMAGFPMGNPRPLTPAWSPDGRWLAFIQRVEDYDGLFLVPAAGGAVVPLARPPADVTDFSWADDATTLDYETNAPRLDAERRQAQEGRDGYRYDDRFWMLATTTPFVRGSFEAARVRLTLNRTGAVRTAIPMVNAAVNAGANRAWVSLDSQPAGAFRTRVHARVGSAETPCRFQTCEAAEAAWWSAPLQSVVFVRREGHASSRTALYTWRPGRQAPRRIAATDDALSGCTLAGERLVCGRERSAFPRDIISFDLQTGHGTPLVDLNPEWNAVAPARITRLRWTNRFGLPAFGDLVVPQRVAVEARLPLVVVQYETRGFLRGGTGDEYPIRAMADAGFAVLSINRPMDLGVWLARSGRPASQQDLMANWADRASVHDSLLEAIRQAAAVVPLDMSRIAVTGLSDGASTATYALIHSRVFSLALLSTCCEDPAVTTTAIGPAYEEMQRMNGYPVPWERHRDSWHEMSLAMNAEHICAEIQIQAADREARMALATVAAVRNAGVRIEMYLYPDEYHVKWQPAHRAAIYRRNLNALVAWRSRPPVACPSQRTTADLTPNAAPRPRSRPAAADAGTDGT
ncbi:Atxe2 family lasso peptide isopeptidase [Novosphingobium fluoreni]|nr:Atxe2 family lasso peptide isopeptidase [Novosphingobium fluoreni]